MLHEETIVRSLEDIAQGIYHLRLYAPGIVAEGVTPGQFVHIALPGATQHVLRRPISVMGVRPQTGELDLVIQKAGEGTTYLRTVSVGSTLGVLGVLGRGFDIGQAKRVLFVGGGVGVAPIRYALDILTAYPGVQAEAFFGFRSGAHAYGLEKLPCPVQVVTDDGSMGKHALVTDVLQEAIEATERVPDLILACGPTPMLRTVQHLAVRQRIPCQLSLEEYMACGMGACLVCNCKLRVKSGTEYRRVCVDGPVFEAKEVCFDG